MVLVKRPLQIREYESKVVNKLKNGILKDRNIKEYYRVNRYEFDIVELDDNENILYVYEITTQLTYRHRLNYIKDKLIIIKNITKAKEVYLVYLDNNDKLVRIALSHIGSNDIEYDKEKSVSSFSGFYKEIQEICKEDLEIRYFFRGHSNCDYVPIPSIYRNDNLIKNESYLFYEAIRKKTSEFTEDMTTFDKLVKMQHYELPTRLLDITTNPLVALYFACQENNDKDGEVIIFSIGYTQIENFDSENVCVLSNLVKFSNDFSLEKNKDTLITEVNRDKPNFDVSILEDVINGVYCVLPKLNNDRIIRQSGAFFIFGMGATKDNVAKFQDQPIKIKIKSKYKKNILKELQLLGIDEASLFPEIDKVMKQIKSQI